MKTKFPKRKRTKNQKPKKAHKYRLYPNKEVKNILAWTSNELRKLYNYFLKQYRKEDKRISKLPLKDQEKEWIKLRDSQVIEVKKLKEQNPKLYNIQSQVLQAIPRRILSVWNGFLTKREEFKELKKKAKYPRIKKKGWYDNVVYPQRIVSNCWTFKIDKGQLLIKQGSEVEQSKRILAFDIRLHTQKKNGQKEPRPLPIDKVKTLIISWKNDKYFASFAYEIEPQLLPETDKKVGIDMGLTTFVATSDGKLYDKERKHYKKAEKKMIKTQRRLSRRIENSNGWKEAKRLLANKWESFANQRKHETHQVVNDLIQEYGVIVREDLKIKNLVRNHCLAKRIHNASWGITFNILSYKAKGAGRKVFKVSPHNTSQMCSSSNCGELREPRLKRNQKIFNCFKCGLKMNRDINAAKNILKRHLTERRGTSPWEALANSKEEAKKPVMVKNHKFSTEKFPSSNLIRD